jgi:hypothetical protein
MRKNAVWDPFFCRSCVAASSPVAVRREAAGMRDLSAGFRSNDVEVSVEKTTENLHRDHFPLTLSDAAFTSTHPECG